MTAEELNAFIDENLVSGPGQTQALSRIFKAIVAAIDNGLEHPPAPAPAEPEDK